MRVISLLVALLAVLFYTPEASARRYLKPVTPVISWGTTFQFFQSPSQLSQQRHVKIRARATTSRRWQIREVKTVVAPHQVVQRKLVHYRPFRKHRWVSPEQTVDRGVTGTAGVTSETHISHPNFAWCGWWMQIKTGITSATTKLNLNVAREWAHVGNPASGPCENCIMVEPHHVSQITKVIDAHTVMAISGNDGHRVRERIRRTNRAVAFRAI